MVEETYLSMLNIQFFAIGRNDDSFGLKAYIYHNTGIELTRINTADSDFVLTHNTGIVFGGFWNGNKEKYLNLLSN